MGVSSRVCRRRAHPKQQYDSREFALVHELLGQHDLGLSAHPILLRPRVEIRIFSYAVTWNSLHPRFGNRHRRSTAGRAPQKAYTPLSWAKVQPFFRLFNVNTAYLNEFDIRSIAR